jgi:hypothetical protein
MKTTTKLAAAAVGVGVIIREVSRGSRVRVGAAANGTDTESRSRWRAVTVYKPPGEIAPDGVLPPPLAELGDSIEVRITPAPGGKGTELAARLKDAGEPSAAARLTGQDPWEAVRSALRRSKQLLEVGEVIRVEPQPTGHRTSTPAGKVIDAVAGRAGGQGVL